MPTKPKETKTTKKAPAKKKEAVKKPVVKQPVAEEKKAAAAVVEPEISEKAKSVIIDGEEFTAEPTDKDARYFAGLGRRKNASARVLLFTKGNKEFIINGKDYKDYFQTFDLQEKAAGALNKMKSLERFKITADVRGGGLTGQAEAIRLAIARALIVFSADYRKRLKKAGFLTRDSRKKERKKPGLKRARKAPQFSKR
jgi:small subunit ribosomal protein S9